MNNKTLVLNDQPQDWIDEIIHSHQSLLLAGANSAEEPNVEFNEDKFVDTRQIGLFTSASTGKAKCIWNSLERLIYNAEISARAFEVTANDQLLMMAKPWHVAGLSWMLMAKQLGANWKFITTRRGEAAQWHRAILDVQPDCLLTVPNLLEQLLAYDDWFVPRIIFGGAFLNLNSYKPLFNHCSTIYQAYGQTEAGGLISCDKLQGSKKLKSSIARCYGQPPEEFELQCSGTAEEPECIYLRSPTAIYDDFYDTGDIGYLDDSGKIYLNGRKPL